MYKIYFLSVATVLALLTTAHSQGQIITTIAGRTTLSSNTDSCGESALGDGGPATTALLRNPIGLCRDKLGNIYVAGGAGTAGPRIRKIEAGIITTIAGGGTSVADTVMATDARIAPNGICIDTAGNILIADGIGYNRIRKLDQSTGILTTLAGNGTYGYSGDGGPAINATFKEPVDVKVDKNNNVYVADCGNFRIRKIDAASSIISTIAGDGSAGFSGDGGMATAAQINKLQSMFIDTGGNLFFADWPNNRIRKITANTGIVSTVAGIGIGLYGGDGTPATAAPLRNPRSVTADDTGNLYIASEHTVGSDRLFHIRKVSAATGIISTFAGGIMLQGDDAYPGDGCPADSAYLHDPRGMFFDTSGNLYVAEYAGCRVRKIRPLQPAPVVESTPDLAEPAEQTSVQIIPNPTRGVISLSCMSNSTPYRLLAITGAVVSRGIILPVNPTINLAHLPPGTYLLELSPLHGQRILLRLLKD